MRTLRKALQRWLPQRRQMRPGTISATLEPRLSYTPDLITGQAAKHLNDEWSIGAPAAAIVLGLRRPLTLTIAIRGGHMNFRSSTCIISTAFIALAIPVQL